MPKLVLFFSLILGLVASAGAAFGGEKTITLSVPGMYCAACPYIVSQAISDVKGVKTVQASYANRSAIVVFDNAITSSEAVMKALTKIGYESQLDDAAS